MIKHMRWQDGVAIAEKSGKPWVLATVISTAGSTPRNAGSKIVITSEKCYDTIGGGQLEYLVQQKAQSLLNESNRDSCQLMEHFSLAAQAKQCCGGSVAVLFEYFAAPQDHIVIFGAGHVASALVSILAQMPVSVSWIDNRENLIGDEQLELPANVEELCVNEPESHVTKIQPDSIALIMTHDHILDYKILCALMDRKDCRFIGLIGSQTKALRFRKRLKSDAFSSDEIESIHCPVGLADIPGKLPIHIAISIAAQITQLTHADKSKPKQSGLEWKQLKQSMNHANHRQEEPSS